MAPWAGCYRVLIGAPESLPREQLLKSFSEDWEARQISYDELKPKTVNLSPVSGVMYVVDPRLIFSKKKI